MDYAPSVSSATNPVYHALDPSRKQIRVLILQPGDADADLHGSLVIASLEGEEEKAQYEAISYCWGDAEQRSHVRLNGYTIGTPASAAEALNGLRHISHPRRLWIDAVCINQHDIKERESQVSFMSYVYTGATQTNIWLGLPHGHTDRALQSLDTLMALVPNRFQQHDLDGNFMGGLKREAAYLHPSLLPDIPVLAEIFHRPWFTRLWVYQEIVLSPLSICQIGPHSFAWHKVETVAMLLLYLPRFQDMQKGITKAWVDSIRFSTGARLGRHSSNLHEGSRLLPLLQLTRKLRCRDPRDKIYGVLALTRWGRCGEPLPLNLRPDYSSSPMQCFREATRHIIHENGTLNYIMSLDGQRSQSDIGKSWPSWVFDAGLFTNQYRHATIPAPFYNADNNAGVTLVQPESVSDDALCVTGYPLCTIGLVLPAFEWRADQTPDFLKQIKSVFQSMSWNIEATTDVEERTAREVSFMVLIAGTYEYHGLVQGTEEFEASFAAFERALAEETWEIDDPTGAVEQTRRAILLNCLNRCSFWTQNPKHLGMGPSELQKGDVVAILYGCSFPVVLRPQVNGWYKLIGHCYIYGIMDGEAVRQKQAEGIEPEVIEIR